MSEDGFDEILEGIEAPLPLPLNLMERLAGTLAEAADELVLAGVDDPLPLPPLLRAKLQRTLRARRRRLVISRLVSGIAAASVLLVGGTYFLRLSRPDSRPNAGGFLPSDEQTPAGSTKPPSTRAPAVRPHGKSQPAPQCTPHAAGFSGPGAGNTFTISAATESPSPSPSGTPSPSPSPSPTESPSPTPTPTSTGLSMTITANPPGGVPGNPVTFTFTITNTDAVPIFDIKVVDEDLVEIGILASLDPAASGTLTYASTFPNDGDIAYSATAKGKDAGGREVTTSATVKVALVQSGTVLANTGC